MNHSINNKPVPNRMRIIKNNSENIEIYELRDAEDYCLAVRYNIKDIQNIKDTLININSIEYINLKIIKINIQFTEIK